MKNKPRKLNIESVREKRSLRESIQDFNKKNPPFYKINMNILIGHGQLVPIINIPIKHTDSALKSSYTTTEKPINFWQKLRVKITKFFFSLTPNH
jgi:hypothetical protein